MIVDGVWRNQFFCTDQASTWNPDPKPELQPNGPYLGTNFTRICTDTVAILSEPALY